MAAIETRIPYTATSDLKMIRKTNSSITNIHKSITGIGKLLRDKVSVNTGKFVPGVYRVNPYTTYMESFSAGSSGYAFTAAANSFTDKGSDASYFYEATCGGDYIVPLVDKARADAGTFTQNLSNYPERSLLKAYGKLGDSKAGVGETLGEIRETLTLLRHPFKDLRDFLSSANYKRVGLLQKLVHWFNSGHWIGPRGVLFGASAAKAAANAWLEFRYGLMPLVYTVQDLIEVANMQIATLDPKKIRTKRAKVEIVRNISQPVYEFGIGYNVLKTYPKVTDKIVCRSQVQYQLSGVPSLTELMGLSPKYLPELAWELTRLSFVVDWWYDVGAWLGGLRFNPEIKVLGNTVGIRINRSISVDVESRMSLDGSPFTSRGPVGSYTCDYYERRVQQHLPLLPLFKPECKSINHTIDGLALILQPVLDKLLKVRKRS